MGGIAGFWPTKVGSAFRKGVAAQMGFASADAATDVRPRLCSRRARL